MRLVTMKQALALRELGFREPTARYAYDFNGDIRLQKNMMYIKFWKKAKLLIAVPTVDEVIDWLRRKHHLMIYNAAAPYVDPTTNKIKYGFRIKRCNIKWGWNQREIFEKSVWSTDCYAAKRTAIWMAIRYLKAKKI